MKAIVTVRLKNGVLDPQGKAIHKSLKKLGFDGIDDVRQGKIIELDLDDDVTDANSEIKRMCDELLVNSVIENYEIEIKK